MISCPNCNGNLKFDIALQKLHCSFCDSAFDPYAFDEKDKDGIENTYETTIFTCPECAGEIESTDTDVTGFCPFCGASTIFYSRMSNEKKPDYVIPFKLTKEDCKNAYDKRTSKLLFLPKEFKNSKYIDGFRGIYVPYWAYDISQEGPLDVKGKETHRSGDYLITKHYRLTGDMDNFYNGVSYDASSSFSDDISERIAPFDVHQKQKFTAGFLSGFYADTADVSEKIYENDALAFATRTTTGEINKVTEFKNLEIEIPKDGNYNGKISKVSRVLFPVWFMSYRNNDAIAYATINAQTGKVSADFPIDVKKFFGFSAVLALVLFMILNLIFTFKPTTLSIITAVLAVIALVCYLVEQSNINNRKDLMNDRGYLNAVHPKRTGKKNGKKVEGTYNKIPIISCIIAIVMSAIMAITGSIHDEIHYIVNSISAILVAVTLVYLILDYNRLIMRPLPQFRKKGGDDAA